MKIRRIVRYAALGVFVWTLGCPAPPSSPVDLDTAVRGDMSPQIWASLRDEFKYLECLRYHVSLMRKRVSQVTGPVALIEYYPTWLRGLDECAKRYPVDAPRVEQLREALGTQMAKVLGEETSSYLHLMRLYEVTASQQEVDRKQGDWVDKWRAFAIVGVAGAAEVLPEPK
jgi:hypothetical protein